MRIFEIDEIVNEINCLTYFIIMMLSNLKSNPKPQPQKSEMQPLCHTYEHVTSILFSSFVLNFSFLNLNSYQVLQRYRRGILLNIKGTFYKCTYLNRIFNMKVIRGNLP